MKLERILGAADSAHEYIQRFSSVVLKKLGDDHLAPATIYFVLSDGAGLQSRIDFQDGAYNVCIPVGMGLRLAAWYSVLLPYWGFEDVAPYYIASPFDSFSQDHFYLPEGISPIFNDETNSEKLRARISGIRLIKKISCKAEYDIQVMLELSHIFVLLHEAAHAVRGHFKHLRLMNAGYRLNEFDLTIEQARRCIETDADTFAATVHASLMAREFQPAIDPQTIGRSGLRVSYALCALLGLLDWNRKQVSHFTGLRYRPPTIRYMIVARTYTRTLADLIGDIAVEFSENETEGWRRCILAMHAATSDWDDGGSRAVGKIVWPLGGMNVGGEALARNLDRLVQEEMALFQSYLSWRQTVMDEDGA